MTYFYNGGTAGTTNPTAWTYDVAQYASAATRIGHTFNGWYAIGTNINYSTAKYGSTASPTITIINGTTRAWGDSAGASTYFVNLSSTAGGTVTLTVQWIANIYTVNYNYGGGTAGVTNPTAWTYDVAQYASAPTRIGYTFYGWYATGTNINYSIAK
ncbi:MAG: InlB B-repeat-containing protein, partial [Clostridia bacterium]|nr:InlB B-repeat-containing protein [Clostridia bacterium]